MIGSREMAELTLDAKLTIYHKNVFSQLYNTPLPYIVALTPLQVVGTRLFSVAWGAAEAPILNTRSCLVLGRRGRRGAWEKQQEEETERVRNNGIYLPLSESPFIGD